ncbi:MAG: ECF transporter S component [Candidatus Cloacimonetes bacterium]|nr:ECF transporter S component [Candidatus Cloacimonadota bacterium]
MSKLKISEIVFIAVVSASLGIFWWGYTFFYDLCKPLLKPLALENLLGGIWLMGALFFPYIIRKPGSALLGEVIAAFIQGFIARWGITSLLWGLVQALPVELFFLLLAYKRWNLWVLCLAGMISATASYALSVVWERYYLLSLPFNLIQWGSFLLSSILLGAVFSKWLADNLAKTGALNQFAIVRKDLE